MKTLYARIHQKKEGESFWRCAIQFSRAWKKVSDLDAATAQRLAEEQMLEVTETKPVDFVDDVTAGDSAVVSDNSAVGSVPLADAVTTGQVLTGAGEVGQAPVTDAPAGNTEAPAPNTGDTANTDQLTEAPTGNTEATAPTAGDAAKTDKPTDATALAEMIKAAVSALDQQDPLLWTANGKPKVEAIAMVTGWPVTAEERDTALGSV